MRINWLSILRGWVVILVIIFHSSPDKNASGELWNIFHSFNIIFSFRMALFFFISGFLLYYTKIQKNSSFVVILKERIPRIVYPYLFFTLVLVLLKFIFSAYVKRPVELTFSSILNIFLYPETHPWETYWFLNVILIFFLLYPVLKYSLKNKYLLVGTVFICLGLNLFFPKDIHLLDLSTVASYILFFYVGILFAKFQGQDYLKSHVAGLGLLVFFILSFFLDYHNLLRSFSGIGISIYFSLLCSEKIPNLFSSFRNYYYQIYLLGTFVQAGIFQLQIKFGNSHTHLITCFLSALSGIYIPVLISKIIQKLHWKPLLKVIGF